MAAPCLTERTAAILKTPTPNSFHFWVPFSFSFTRDSSTCSPTFYLVCLFWEIGPSCFSSFPYLQPFQWLLPLTMQIYPNLVKLKTLDYKCSRISVLPPSLVNMIIIITSNLNLTFHLLANYWITHAHFQSQCLFQS